MEENTAVLSDFTSKWMKIIAKYEWDEDELTSFLEDIEISKEEYIAYSADASYDISTLFEVLIYYFIVKNNPDNLVIYLSETMTYLNRENLNKKSEQIIYTYYTL